WVYLPLRVSRNRRHEPSRAVRAQQEAHIADGCFTSKESTLRSPAARRRQDVVTTKFLRFPFSRPTAMLRYASSIGSAANYYEEPRPPRRGSHRPGNSGAYELNAAPNTLTRSRCSSLNAAAVSLPLSIVFTDQLWAAAVPSTAFSRDLSDHRARQIKVPTRREIPSGEHVMGHCAVRGARQRCFILSRTPPPPPTSKLQPRSRCMRQLTWPFKRAPAAAGAAPSLAMQPQRRSSPRVGPPRSAACTWRATRFRSAADSATATAAGDVATSPGASRARRAAARAAGRCRLEGWMSRTRGREGGQRAAGVGGQVAVPPPEPPLGAEHCVALPAQPAGTLRGSR
ncbi:hypothetical protein PybrP1_013075, partial [[Pythium] brassicae (nom. inval.)]